MIRILHSADIQVDPGHREGWKPSLEKLRDTARERRVDLIVIAGDLFERGIQASDRDGMPELLSFMREILDIAPVVAVYGTPTHDVPGCYEVLTHLDAAHRLWVLWPDSAYYLCDDGQIHSDDYLPAKLLILGCPEPGKEWLLAGKNGLGSAEATQAANDAMKGLLLGLGSMRREHPDIPAVMVYHGAVRGATMGSGQIVGSAEIAIGREDLEMVSADYYALGHIHEPQTLTPTMQYAGSAYPVDWGETTQRSCVLVEMETGPVEGRERAGDIERIPFPHPPRCKIESDGFDLDPLLDDRPMDGKQTWLVVRNTAENLGDLDEAVMLAWLIDHGALPGSRVTFESIPVETVRAAEIAEEQHLRGKVEVWAEAGDTGVPRDSVLDKADELEREARETGAVGAGAHIRIRSLRLRGAIGTWKGLGVDEVYLDLDTYGPGLIALVGKNGEGKSTLIENLHPFPRLLTRGGSLQSHFRLKDSCRELTWVDEACGVEYRATMLLDPTLSTPKAEYHLARKDATMYDGGSPWTPLTNGRKEDYEDRVAELWGSVELFARSAFVAQKPPRGLPDLADATPAERKGLFRELGGLDYLQTYAETAKARADGIETGIGEDRARADVLRPILATEPQERAGLEETQAALAEAQTHAGEVLAEGRAQKLAVDALEKRLTAQREIATRIAALDGEAERLDDEMYVIAQRIDASETAMEGRDAAAAIVQKAEDLTKAKGVLQDEAAKVATRREALWAEHGNALATHRRDRDEVAQEIRRLERAAAEVERKKAGLVAEVDAHAPQLAKALTTACPTCGQMLPPEKCAELARDRVAKDKAQKERQEAILGLDGVLTDNEQGRKRQEIQLAEIIEPQAPPLPTFAQQPALDAVVAELRALDVPRAQETIRAANAAQAAIKAAEERRAQIEARRQTIAGDRAQLHAHIEPKVHEEWAEAGKRLDALREQYTEAAKDVSRLEAEERAGIETLEDLAEKGEQLAEIEARVRAAEAELADWRYLERACGRDGIQALELDALGPGIAATANALLDAGYGSRFRVEIRTTRFAGKGSKVRQVEDFEIIIHDSERGTEQPLDTLSGGETVWIRKALYDAFGVIRARTTGTQFLVACLDEADGALDPDARRAYLRMLEAAHVASGRHQTIVITHSPDAQEAIPQRLEMRDLAGVGKEAAA